jgi:hypothetical protein
MKNIEEFNKINDLLKKEKQLESVMCQIKNSKYSKGYSRLNDISSSFRFENTFEFEIIRNSIVDIVEIRLDEIEKL